MYQEKRDLEVEADQDTIVATMTTMDIMGIYYNIIYYNTIN